MIVRGEADASCSIQQKVTQEASQVKEECAKLAKAAELHGGHCQKWVKALHAVISRAHSQRSQPNSAGSVLRKPDLITPQFIDF